MRVLIADDHRLIIEGIRRALDEAGDFDVVGECSSGSQVLPMVGRTNPDVVLLDLRMPGADGLSCLTRIRSQHPQVKVVILSSSTDENVIANALKRGASAYVVKSVNPADLPSILRQTHDGTVYTTIGLPQPNENPAHTAGLTERETTILAALARGLSNDAIAKELWVAEQTVKFHSPRSTANSASPTAPKPPASPTKTASSKAPSTTTNGKGPGHFVPGPSAHPLAQG